MHNLPAAGVAQGIPGGGLTKIEALDSSGRDLVGCLRGAARAHADDTCSFNSRPWSLGHCDWFGQRRLQGPVHHPLPCEVALQPSAPPELLTGLLWLEILMVGTMGEMITGGWPDFSEK